MKDTEVLTEAIVAMDENRAMELTKQLLEANTAPMAVFEAFRQALVEVGKRFEQGVCFIPELVMSGNMMKTAMEIIKPYMTGDEVWDEQMKIGKILIATVEGDIHDIGKNIVKTMLIASGYEVVDLGKDVSPAEFIEKAKSEGAQVIAMSTLMTPTLMSMKSVEEKLRKEGLKDKVKVIVGGGVVGEVDTSSIGVDHATSNASEGIRIIEEWISHSDNSAGDN